MEKASSVHCARISGAELQPRRRLQDAALYQADTADENAFDAPSAQIYRASNPHWPPALFDGWGSSDQSTMRFIQVTVGAMPDLGGAMFPAI